jgi:hypothetical protein
MFFSPIYNVINNAKALNEDEIFIEAVNDEVKNLIKQLNTVDQLGEFGIDSEGDSLGEYAPFTVERRSELGLQVDHIDFKITGDYWGSWRVEVKGDVIEIFVNKERYDELVDDLSFSDTHVGLTDDNIAILSAMMAENYKVIVRRKLFS